MAVYLTGQLCTHSHALKSAHAMDTSKCVRHQSLIHSHIYFPTDESHSHLCYGIPHYRQRFVFAMSITSWPSPWIMALIMYRLNPAACARLMVGGRESS